MQKVALFAFTGDPSCFIHVLLNAHAFADRGAEVTVVIEGSATKLVADMVAPGHPLHAPYARARERGLLAGVCRACAQKTGSLGAAQAQGLRLLDDMSGHPGMPAYAEQGYTIITF